MASYKVLRSEKMVRGMLVVAPLRPAKDVWPNEVAKWANFSDIDLVLLRGKDRERLVTEQHDVYVINYESLDFLFNRVRPLKKDGTPNMREWRYRATEAGKALLEHVDVLVWDELSKMKHSNTLRFQLIKPHLHKFRRRWGLTGSPASNGLLDLFGQCYVLDEGRTLGPFITHYKTQYFRAIDKLGYVFVPLPGAEEQIYDRLKPLMLSMDADDYLTLPKEMPHIIKLDFPGDARTAYEELEEELITLINSEVITAANKAVSHGKCRQICAGAIYTPNVDPVTGVAKTGKREWAEVHSLKLDALEELVDELQGQQLLIGYEFHHDLERILKRFPNMPYIGGGVSDKRGSEIIKEWNAGNIQNLAGHPASMAHGLNLQEGNAHHICWHTVPWDFELYDQLNRRLRRSGNTAKLLHIYHLIMKDSVEESVVFALRRKRKTQRDLRDAISSRVRVSEEDLA